MDLGRLLTGAPFLLGPIKFGGDDAKQPDRFSLKLHTFTQGGYVVLLAIQHFLLSGKLHSQGSTLHPQDNSQKDEDWYPTHETAEVHLITYFWCFLRFFVAAFRVLLSPAGGGHVLSRGHKYLTTQADGDSQNNLLSLPECL
jgi:quinol-cytochrome oxidoreductase complex cytochrome b subunit